MTTSAPDVERPVAPEGAEAPTPPPPRPSGRSAWGSVTAGAVLIVLGLTWLLDLAGVIELRAAFVLPALLTLVGAALMVGSFRGSHPGLIVFGTVLAFLTGFAAVVPSESVRGGIGEQRHTISTPAELESRYELGLGNIVLDMEDLDLDDRRQVRISLGAGDVDVILPDDLPVLIDAESGAGEVVLFGEKTDGVGVDRTYRSDDYQGADARLHLRIEVGAGSIEVSR